MAKIIEERELATLAKKIRVAAKKSRTAAARELGVSRVTMHQAEEYSNLSLTKLRCRIIARYSAFEAHGPVFVLRRKPMSTG